MLALVSHRSCPPSQHKLEFPNEHLLVGHRGTSFLELHSCVEMEKPTLVSEISPDRERKEKKNYLGSETLPISVKEMGPNVDTLVHIPYDHPTSKFRLREVWQAEKEDRLSNKKESRMIAERLEF
eukprot:1161126-Pelagomonas_calceolata.AAC.7